MAARGRDLEGPLRTVLTANVGEIAAGRGDRRTRTRVADEAKREAMPLCERDCVMEHVDGVDVDALDERGFGGIAARHDNGLEARPTRGDRHREHAAGETHGPVERELAEDHEALHRECVDLLVEGEERERDCEIEAGPHLLELGGCEIDEHAPRRKAVASVDDRGAHAILCFAESAVGKTDNRETGRPRAAVGLDANDVAIDARHRGRMGECEHAHLQPGHRDEARAR